MDHEKLATQIIKAASTVGIEAGIKHRGTDPVPSLGIELSKCIEAKLGDTDHGQPAILMIGDLQPSYVCQHPGCNCTFEGFAAKLGISLDGKPTIIVDPANLETNVAIAIAALSKLPNIYQRGKVLVQISRDAPKPPLCLDDDGSPQLQPIPKATLLLLLSSAARWLKPRGKKLVPCTPSDDIVSAVYAANELPGIPVICGIVSSPFLRSDGTVCRKPGYDESTGIYLDADGEFPELMEPAEAIAILDDVLTDFPFASPANKSAWLSALITLLTRNAFEGNAPMHLVGANISRLGKGLLTDLLTMIVEGRRAARYPWSSDDAEVRKVITSVALLGLSYLIFDNCKGTVGGSALEKALTDGRWSDRLLALNKSIDVALNLLFAGTGNNCKLTTDMIGRTLSILMESECENPSQRSGFKYPDLLGHVKRNRRHLAIAALSIPAAYVAAGRPNMQLPPWGGFQPWSDLVRNSIVWAGLPDPGLTRTQLAGTADDDTKLLSALMDGWQELGFAATVKVARELAETPTADGYQYPTLREVLAEFKDSKDIAYFLRDQKGRVVGGRKFVKTDHKIPKWEVITIKKEAA